MQARSRTTLIRKKNRRSGRFGSFLLRSFEETENLGTKSLEQILHGWRGSSSKYRFRKGLAGVDFWQVINRFFGVMTIYNQNIPRLIELHQFFGDGSGRLDWLPLAG
jgi:hypothetical protein